jgi:hypothetical protein
MMAMQGSSEAVFALHAVIFCPYLAGTIPGENVNPLHTPYMFTGLDFPPILLFFIYLI